MKSGDAANPDRSSTRLAIATQALDDARERLMELPHTVHVRMLRDELRACASELHECTVVEPPAENRAALLERVLELYVEVTRLARKLDAR